jgi:hypothetical protein
MDDACPDPLIACDISACNSSGVNVHIAASMVKVLNLAGDV